MGVDPGKSGAACLISGVSGNILDFIDWPKSDNYYEVYYQTRVWKTKNNIRLCVLEKVASMHGQGVKSVFSFGKNYGAWLMLLSSLRIPHQLITPAQWQKGLVTKTDGPDPKSRAKNVCCRLFGHSHFHGPRGGYKDGRGDASLMAFKARLLYK